MLDRNPEAESHEGGLHTTKERRNGTRGTLLTNKSACNGKIVLSCHGENMGERWNIDEQQIAKRYKSSGVERAG